MENKAKIVGLLSQVAELCPAGFAIALHIRYTTPRFLFQSYPKDWMDLYSEKGLVLKDPTVLWGFTNSGVVDWNDLVDLDEAGVLKMAGEHGLKHGFTFAHDSDGSKSISSFARETGEFSQQEIDSICSIVAKLHHSTADLEKLPPELTADLRKMSMEFTHG